MNIDIQSEESDIQSEESVLPKDGVVYSAIVYSRGSTRLASCKRCGLWTLRYPEAGKKLSLLWLTLGWSHLHAHDATVFTWPLTTHHVLCRSAPSHSYSHGGMTIHHALCCDQEHWSILTLFKPQIFGCSDYNLDFCKSICGTHRAN